MATADSDWVMIGVLFASFVALSSTNAGCCATPDCPSSGDNGADVLLDATGGCTTIVSGSLLPLVIVFGSSVFFAVPVVDAVDSLVLGRRFFVGVACGERVAVGGRTRLRGAVVGVLVVAAVFATVRSGTLEVNVDAAAAAATAASLQTTTTVHLFRSSRLPRSLQTLQNRRNSGSVRFRRRGSSLIARCSAVASSRTVSVGRATGTCVMCGRRRHGKRRSCGSCRRRYDARTAPR